MAYAFIGVYYLPRLCDIGLPTYLRQLGEPDSIFGDVFRFAPLALSGHELFILEDVGPVEVYKAEVEVSLDAVSDRAAENIRRMVRESYRAANVVGVLVASWDYNHGHGFQSAWYTLDGFHQLLLKSGFDRCRITLSPRGKGIIAIITPESPEAASGTMLVTALNNVIGCIYYKDQIAELRKLARLVKEH